MWQKGAVPVQYRFALDDLRLVRAIGEAGTLTGAVRRLSVDHSTAFRRLGAVEKRLGVHLFERARDGYTPTRQARRRSRRLHGSSTISAISNGVSPTRTCDHRASSG